MKTDDQNIRKLAPGDSIAVRVTPRAAADRIIAEVRGHDALLYKVYVTAIPEDNKANKAVTALLAKYFGVAKSRLVLKSGRTDRDKIFVYRP